MDDKTPATKSRHRSGQHCRYNHSGLPPLKDHQSFVGKHMLYYGSTQKTHEAIEAMSNVVARCHRGCLEQPISGLVAGPPQLVSSSEFKPATDENDMDREVAVARCHGHVAPANTRQLCDGVAINSEPSLNIFPQAFTRHLSEKPTTKKTSELPEVVSGDGMRTGGNKGRRDVSSA
ncbi:hypothetical protein MRX96_015051 [Rhipicephalus microplus]